VERVSKLWIASGLVTIAMGAAGCDALTNRGGSGGGGGVGVIGTSEAGTRRGSAGGFSAVMLAEMGGAPAAAQGGGTGSGSESGSESGSGSESESGSGSESRSASDSGSATGPEPKPSANPDPSPDPSPNPDPKPSPNPDPRATSAVATPASKRGPVKVSADLAAIKFDLEPNWDRDYEIAGSLSLVVKVPATGETRVFFVYYGYEDTQAPFDCDLYRKYLEDKKLLDVTLNRQSGAACYVEGLDAKRVETFRYLVNYGGKRLLCHGPRYKDAASAALGDLRDKVLMQAKKNCESMTM
jgi:hypothetical protein